jgi:hypothetical protein
MSNPTDQTPGGIDAAAPYVQLFQKAHQKIVMLERLEEQVAQLVSKRQELQDELRDIQTQINDEFDTRLRSAAAAAGNDGPSARALSVSIGDAVKRNSGASAAASSGPRFAATAIDADSH